jgi:hypothetical protein
MSDHERGLAVGCCINGNELQITERARNILAIWFPPSQAAWLIQEESVCGIHEQALTLLYCTSQLRQITAINYIPIVP